LFGVRGLTDDARVFGSDVIAGVDTRLLKDCVNEGVGREGVLADTTEGRRLGVKGTPTIFIGPIEPSGTIRLRSRFVGAISYDVLRHAIEAALNRS
jgi:protein-disulfide isomerase